MMVYYDQDMCDSKLGKFMQAFRADRPDEWQMDEFIRMAEDMNNEIARLRQAEKDAARYRWLRDEARHHMDGGPLAFMTDYDGEPIAYPECGMVIHESYIDEAIDEAMQCK